MYWQFRNVHPDEVETEITQRDQFRNDEVDLSDTLVREAVQNSLDAQADDQRVEVCFRILEDENAPDAEFLRSLFETQLDHANAAGLSASEVAGGPASVLIIEDFGTTGLSGATDLKDTNHFSDFWRRHGKSHKSGKSGGRWGLGKLVYSYSSEIGAFFGVTVRIGDSTQYLMGQTVLNTHTLNGSEFAPHGFFAKIKSKDPQKGLQIPLSEEGVVGQMAESFQLERSDKAGLSVVIPYPRHEEIDRKKMIGVGVTNYYFPILTEQLTLRFDDVQVDKSTLREVFSEHAPDKIKDADRLFDFVEAAHSLSEDEYYALDTDWYSDWKLTEEDFDEDILESIRDRFAEHELVAIRLKVSIRQKDGTDSPSFVDLFLRSDPDLQQGHDLYIRGGITIPGETKFRHRKALGALVARHEPIAGFLGDAENAAHTKWNGRAEKLTSKYKYPSQTLSAIRNSLVQLHDVLAQAVEEEAEDALLDFFWTAGAQPAKKKKSTRTPPPPAEVVVKRRPRVVRVEPTKNGFRLAPTSEAKQAEFPLRCDAAVAYDTRKGNPFRRYEYLDFDLADHGQIGLSSENVQVVKRTENKLSLILESPGFHAEVSGFDAERDVVVRLSTTAVKVEES